MQQDHNGTISNEKNIYIWVFIMMTSKFPSSPDGLCGSRSRPNHKSAVDSRLEPGERILIVKNFPLSRPNYLGLWPFWIISSISLLQSEIQPLCLNSNPLYSFRNLFWATVYFLGPDSWVLDNWTPGPTFWGPTNQKPNCLGPNLPKKNFFWILQESLAKC